MSEIDIIPENGLNDFEDDFEDDEEIFEAELETSADSDSAEVDPDFIPFTHLHVHSHYSLLDGAGKIDALIKRAKELKMTSLALTDHGNLHGALEFYQKCSAAGIKPIVGYEAYVAPRSRFDKSSSVHGDSNYHLTLLAMNRTGFNNLLILGTLAFTEGFYRKPRIDKELLEKYNEGLICLSGCVGGELAQTIVRGNADSNSLNSARNVAIWYKNLFGDRYYIELQDHGLDIQKTALEPSVQIARELGIPTVATNDVHYVLQEDSDAQDILLCINTRAFRTDTKRMRMESDQFFLRSGREMLLALPTHEDAIRRSEEIAARCSLQMELGKRFFPNFVPPDGKSSDKYLRELCIEGLKRRYADNPKRMINGELSEEVMLRLNRELDVIQKLGFPNYFLIVWDFVRAAEERGIHRTARGSGVGALVCYALNMSHVCPLEFDLLFERFLDENRLEAPDIDIDFDQQRRGEILDYVKKKYGENNVAQIGTFGTLAAKMAIRDVGRALGMPLSQVNDVTKLVPEAPKMTIAKAFDRNPELSKIYESNQDIHDLINYAKKVEGLARSAGTHACAVVISQRPLTDFVPIQRVQGKEEYVTQWAAGDVEKAGLLKMDFLGLRNLSILSSAVDIIEQTTGQRINPYKLPLDDQATYDLLCRGETKGVFQLESGGIRELLIRMKPDNFRDIIATLALYRPGPLEGGMVDDYVNVKHKRKKATYLHPIMKDVLEETNGVMVYQEQIMRIFNRLGKIPLSRTYSSVKAISKKKHEEIEKLRGDFVHGAMENGLSEKESQNLFALIEKFAGYGFNKSHSTAYALIAYTTAYLKAHYPAEFMASLLCGDISGRNFTKKDKTVEHIEDCERMGLVVLPPNINQSSGLYKVIDGKIAFGLTAIKGCGEDAATEIVRARDEGGLFQNIFDFYCRVNTKIVTKSTVESLLKAGAFDCFGVKRSQIMQVLDKAHKNSLTMAADRQKGQKSLFELLNEPEKETTAKFMDQATLGLPQIEEWSDKEKAINEKEVLGFYLTSHPLKEYVEKFKTFASHTVAEASRLPDKTNVLVGGAMQAIKIAVNKNLKEGQSNLYAMFDLEDSSGSIRSIIWSHEYEMFSNLVKPDSIVFASGRIDRQKSQAEDDANLFINQLYSVDEAEVYLTRGIVVSIQEQQDYEEEIKTLYDILKTYRVLKKASTLPGAGSGADLEIQIKLKNGKICILTCPTFKVTVTGELRQRVTERFGKESFHFIPAPIQTKSTYSKPAWKKAKS
ncbi:MAG: DNA polymerase III subunit alpha [Planctomycetia bacterium]|nr:DNA polymerase III subunit alpha [Planctomycetia bacterium]